MSLKICSLSSGSKGNCVFVSSPTTKLLIDAGIPVDRIQKSLRVLGATCENFSVLVTHNHKDHTLSVPAFAKKFGANVYVHTDSTKEHKEKGYILKEISYDSFTIGDITITPFRVSHDVPCVGFKIENGLKSICYLTDVGYVPNDTLEIIKDNDILFIESNHCEELVLGGSYPQMLKNRILSTKGHLSNTDCARVCVSAVRSGRVRQIILGHLSDNNNYKELAFETTCKELASAGFTEGVDVRVEVAIQNTMSGLFEIC